MVPYLEIPMLRIGPATLSPFGILVALGCVAGWLIAKREARIRGVDPVVIDGFLFWALVPGFFGSRVFELAFYNPEVLLKTPWAVLNFWQSMSSFGGFIGGAAGALYYIRSRRLTMIYADCLIVGFIVGWFFGRLGCTLIHDHPGIHTSFPLAVLYPDGPRHDLGLYEWLLTILLASVVFSIDRTKMAPGELVSWICLAYAPVRFLLDFLRAADRLYYGLTAAQFACVGLFLVGAFGLRASRDRAHHSRSGEQAGPG